MVEDLFEIFEELFERKRKKPKHKHPAGRMSDRDAYAEPAPPPRPPVFCLECGTKNDADARFCLDCGSVLPAAGEEMRCLRCDSVVPLKARFCGRCGARVAVGER